MSSDQTTALDVDPEVAPEQASTESVPPAEDAATTTTPFGDIVLDDDGMPNEDDLLNAMRAIVDPEIGYNVVDLGLVYEVTKPEQGRVHVLMTLTSMGCPLTDLIQQQCQVVLGSLPGVDHVEVEFTFSPPWDTTMISEWVAEELRAMGMNV